MIAPITRTFTEQAEAMRREACGRSGGCQWRLVDHFNTVESAEHAVAELRLAGVEAELSLIDGLCVIARRANRACEPVRG